MSFLPYGEEAGPAPFVESDLRAGLRDSVGVWATGVPGYFEGMSKEGHRTRPLLREPTPLLPVALPVVMSSVPGGKRHPERRTVSYPLVILTWTGLRGGPVPLGNTMSSCPSSPAPQLRSKQPQ